MLTEKFRIDFINIAKLEETCYTSDTKELEAFCKLLITKDKKEFRRILGEMKMEREAKEKLEEEVMRYSCDEEVYAIYSDYTTQELERNTIIEDRVEEALLEKRMEIAHHLLKKNKDISLVAEVTGLTTDEIHKIKENL